MRTTKRKPKFRVGQVVLIAERDYARLEYPSEWGCKIWYCSDNTYRSEFDMRPLTRKERGGAK